MHYPSLSKRVLCYFQSISHHPFSPNQRVEAKSGGAGGPRWVDSHVHSFVNIAGPLLGLIKSASSYVSGEMHDTAELGPLEGILFGASDSAFYRLNRRRLFRTYVRAACLLA